MASTNQSPEYSKAQGMFLQAKDNEDKLHWLDEMIKYCPKHKSAEAMLANLKTRRKKLMEKMESARKTGRGSAGKTGIKKEDLQVVIIGKTNVGKSSLLAILTNTKPTISPYPLTTKHSLVGMADLSGVSVQVVENPAVGSEFFDRSVAHSADVLILLVNSLEEVPDLEKSVERYSGKKIIAFNITDTETQDERKIEARLKSKKLNFVIINTSSREGIDDLKSKIFQSFGKIRVFTKEPGKAKSDRPIILSENSSVEQVAEKIFHGFSKQVRETRIWGPSSKFPGQVVGLKHVLKDMDVVEFKTR